MICQVLWANRVIVMNGKASRQANKPVFVSDSQRAVVDAQGDCEKEYERDYSWLHCRNGTALREVARTLKRALGNTLDPLYGA